MEAEKLVIKHASEFATRQLNGEPFEDIKKSIEERNDSHPLDLVKEAAEIGWVKTIGDCETFIMAAMYQQYVELSRSRSTALCYLNDTLFTDEKKDKDKATLAFEYYDKIDTLVTNHIQFMISFKNECEIRKQTSLMS